MTGCTAVSPGCDHCYARRMALRLQAMGVDKYRDGFRPECHMTELSRPYRWRKARKVFVCSMGDLFHEDMPDNFICDVFLAMKENPRHTFQVLTKRALRMQTFINRYYQNRAPENVWLGVSVEDAEHQDRVTPLVSVHAPVRFVSFEPLLGPIPHLPWRGLLNWVIVGCESGPGRRPMDQDWVRSIRDDCIAADSTAPCIPFFLKQAEVDGKVVKMPELDGRQWAEVPK